MGLTSASASVDMKAANFLGFFINDNTNNDDSLAQVLGSFAESTIHSESVRVEEVNSIEALGERKKKNPKNLLKRVEKEERKKERKKERERDLCIYLLCLYLIMYLFIFI